MAAVLLPTSSPPPQGLPRPLARCLHLLATVLSYLIVKATGSETPALRCHGAETTIIRVVRPWLVSRR